MPHITGLGHIDWEFAEELAHGSPFLYDPKTDATFVRLLLRTQGPIRVIRPGFAGIPMDFLGLITPRSEAERCGRLLNLLSLTQGRQICIAHSFSRVGGIAIELQIKGRLRSPEGLMRSIVRRLHHD